MGKVERYIDPDGRYLIVDLPPGCTNPAEGHILGPPLLTEELIQFDAQAYLVRLGNELLANGIITVRDARKNPAGIAKAIRDAGGSIVSVHQILQAFEGEEGQ